MKKRTGRDYEPAHSGGLLFESTNTDKESIHIHHRNLILILIAPHLSSPRLIPPNSKR